MRKLARVLVGAATLVAMTGTPARAITYGQPDAGEHPYVGFTIYWVPADEGWFSCSGTMLDADTFLTAAHCTYGIGTDGAEVEDPEGEILTSGGTDVWVTLDDTDVLAGFPPRADLDTPEELYAARRAWLDANPDYVAGTAYSHPAYDTAAEFPVTYDVGVVELDRGLTLATYGELAPLETVETLLAAADNPNDALVESVGYGVQSVQPHPMDEETRYKSTSRIVENRANIASGGNLHTLNNPSAVGGRGGTCFGDSGGPVLVPDTNLVVAVASFGMSGTCHGADYSWRVDTVDSRAFVEPFLES